MTVGLEWQNTEIHRLKPDDIVRHSGDEWRVLANVAGKKRVTTGMRTRCLTLASLTQVKTVSVAKAAVGLMPKLLTRARKIDWTPGTGDVLLFPNKDIRRAAVAIRSAKGFWTDSACPRIAYPDERMVHAVRFGRAFLLRDHGVQEPLTALHLWHRGTVLAVKDPAEPLPSAWLCLARDEWRGTNGIEASDAMIRQGWERGLYSLLHCERAA